MKALAHYEPVLDLIRTLDSMEDKAISRKDVQAIIDQLWEFDLSENYILNSFVESADQAFYTANDQEEFFGFIGYDLDVILEHYLIQNNNLQTSSW